MSGLNAIYRAIKRLTDQPEPAMERVTNLAEQIDLSRYSPSAIARPAAFASPAQRGFSESMLPTYPNIGATLIRPSEWAYRTPPLDAPRDEQVIQKLQRSLAEKKLMEVPSAVLREFPDKVDVGHEGRHRMQALQRLYGDDPVLVSLLQGSRYKYLTPEDPFFRPGSVTWDYLGKSSLSPLEILKRNMEFGGSPWDPNPLWVKE